MVQERIETRLKAPKAYQARIHPLSLLTPAHRSQPQRGPPR